MVNGNPNLDASMESEVSRMREEEQKPVLASVDIEEIHEMIELLRTFISKNQLQIYKLSMAVLGKIQILYPHAKESCDVVIKELLNSQWSLTEALFQNLNEADSRGGQVYLKDALQGS